MKYSFCLMACFIAYCGSAQPGAASNATLIQLLRLPDDTLKVAKLLKLGDTYTNHSTPLDRLAAARQAMAVAEKIQWEEGFAACQQVLGRAYWETGAFDTAKILHLKSLKAFREKGNQHRVALLLHFLGQDYADSGDYSTALDYLTQALEAYAALKDYLNQSSINNIIAWVYEELGMKPQAMRHNYDALVLSEKIGNQYLIGINAGNVADGYLDQGEYRKAIEIFNTSIQSCKSIGDLSNISIYYSRIADCYEHLGEINHAIAYHNKSIETALKTGKPTDIGTSYAGLGKFYRSRGEYKNALQSFQKAADVFASPLNKKAIAAQFIQIGACYTFLKEYASARKYFNKALPLADELNSISLFNDYYRGLASVDSIQGHWKDAFMHYQQYILTRDSMFNEENTRSIVQSRMQYAFDKKEAATRAEQEKKDALAKEELRRQKILRNGFMGGFAIVLLFAGVFFYQRNKINKGKRVSDELLLNILPAEVAEELKAKGSAEAKMIDEVTVLFSDFKGFTQISERLTPAELVAEINACFSAFDLILQRHNVEKIKTIGDAYMAAGGLPIPNQTHAVDVIRAALEMQEFMWDRRQKRESEGLFAFEARIGAHTGPVVAGIVGIKKFAYDIWGDTVNTAQRMESSSEAGKINISGSTYERVKQHFHCTHRGRIEAKGKGEVDMYFVAPPGL